MQTIELRGLVLTTVLCVGAVAGCADKPNPLARAGGYCDQVMALDAAFAASQEQPDGATPEQLASLAREEARRYLPILERMVTVAPSAVSQEAATFQAEMARMAQAGDDSFLDGPGYGEVNGAIHRAAHDRCGHQRVTISASDYAFAGIPKTLDEGRTSFLLHNVSMSEAHVAVIARMKDGLSDSASQLAADGEAAFEKLDLPPVGGAFAAPTSDGGLIVELKPGRYFVFCDIPTGGAPQGEPHVARGMFAGFTVK